MSDQHDKNGGCDGVCGTSASSLSCSQEPEEDCPLFMTSLPSKRMFRENPALQAVCELAGDTGESLCSDGDESDEKFETVAKNNDSAENGACGGSDTHKSATTQCQRSRERLGVGKRHRRRARIRAHPYTRPLEHNLARRGDRSEREQRTQARSSRYSVGEAQVYMSFLGMPPT